MLPGQQLSETVLTETPEAIDVTVARIPLDIAPSVKRQNPGGPGESFVAGASVVAHFVSVQDASGGKPLEHRVAIPLLAAGLYQVRLAVPQRVAIQYLSVSTMSAMFHSDGAETVVMAFDLRTMRRRTDVGAVVVTPRGLRRFKPSGDGLIHVPPALLERKPFDSNAGGIRRVGVS